MTSARALQGPLPIDWQPEDPANLADPYPLFSRMRDEDPCHWSPRLRAWVLTRYEDVRRVCLDKQLLSSNRLKPFFAALAPPEAERIAHIMRYLSLWMVFTDPPDHTRLRNLTSKVFSAKAMQGIRPQVIQTSEWLLEKIADRDEFDFIGDYAGPLPCLVIMTMLGVPHDELERLKKMSDDMALFIGSARVASEKYDKAEAATREMAEFFRWLIELRRRKPSADLLSELIQLRDGDDRLSNDELVATCILMLFAGHETTTHHIANGICSLVRFPDQLRQLREDPSLAAAAVEELLRYDGPLSAQARIVVEPHEMHGKTLEPGQRLFILLNAANRDPRAFPDADRLNLLRDGLPHLAFGFGQHICLGFPLARIEGAVALPMVLERFREIELLDQQPEWINSLVFRGMHRMPVRVRRN